MEASEAREFSERPGFTLIGGRPTRNGPVLVRVDGSRASFEAIRIAVGQAMTRTCGMVVVDDAAPLSESPHFEDVDERERSVARGIFRNTHVSRVANPSGGPAGVIGQGEQLKASLLVLNKDEVRTVAESPALLARVLDAPFDVLMLG
ncbi:MAG: hypothetical protein WAL25_10740 [Acidimicrobiia bacterium]